MTAHPDILEQPERLRGAFWGSVAFHLSLAAIVVGFTWIRPGNQPIWGAKDGGGPGSIAVNPVASIPLPASSAAKNPVANDTPSEIPAPAPKTKAQPKAKAIEPDAIAIKGKNSKKRVERAAAPTPNKYDLQHPPNPNQVTTTGGRALSSPLIGMQGGGGVGVGTNSVFGTQFGEYATRLRDQVARNWKTAELDARIQTAPPVTVTFTIRRDGKLAPGSVKVSETSGNRAVDFSAQRAVLDADPFPPLPAQYSGSEATVELKFQLRR